MANRGIDYSMGQSNRNKQTGIHYGVIPLHDLNQWAIESFEDDYGPPTCPNCGNEVIEYSDMTTDQIENWEGGGGDYTCINCDKALDGDECYGESPIAWTLDDGEYKAQMGQDDNDIFILESPYYTHAQFCSPCAPGAGHLLNPCDEGPKTYCFGLDWFDKERPCPYPVYSVKTGECLYMPLPSD